MAKYSFRDPVTGELKAWGYMETNQTGDIRQEEPEDFALDQMRGHWRWDGSAWVSFVPDPPLPSELAAALDAALADATPTGSKLRAVLAALRKVTR